MLVYETMAKPEISAKEPIKQINKILNKLSEQSSKICNGIPGIVKEFKYEIANI